jgi:hypothetical protein
MMYKLGKLPPRVDARTLMLGKYLESTLPPPPAAQDYGKQVTAQALKGKETAWPMYGNDTLGDCTCAAVGHMIEVWTANASKLTEVPNAAVIELYRHFNPGKEDNGCNLLDVLSWWRKTAVSGHKIEAFAGIEPKNHTQAKDALQLFGSIYIGLSLPNFTVPDNVDPLTIPWAVPPTGATGANAPNPANGHCVPAVAYDERNLYIITWGKLKAMTWGFYDAYADEAYAVLSPNWLIGHKQSPPGFDMATLKKDLAAIHSTPNSGIKAVTAKS